MSTELRKSTYIITLDDDPVVHQVLGGMLGVISLPFKSPESLLKKASSYRPLGAFIDINLGEGKNGLDIIPKLRSVWPSIPIIVITANPTSEFVSDALATGADDFIKKPFIKEEVIARYNARRRQMFKIEQANSLVIGGVSFNKLHRKISSEECDVFLTPMEASLLEILIASIGTTISREDLKRACWGSLTVSDGALDRHVSGLRNVVKESGAWGTIRAVYGEGYVFELS